MKVRQLSVFLENRPSRLLEVTTVLGTNGINIRALSLADTSDFGILRLIVDEIEKAHTVLKDIGFTTRENDVIACEVPDKPGGLKDVLQLFADSGVNIEYMYAFLEKSKNNAVIIFRVEDIDNSIHILQDHKVPLLKNEDLMSM
jgi:hypothetical protein